MLTLAKPGFDSIMIIQWLHILLQLANQLNITILLFLSALILYFKK